jgi:hypothetical protein
MFRGEVPVVRLQSLELEDESFGNLADELGLTLVVSNMVADDDETFQKRHKLHSGQQVLFKKKKI